MDNLEKVIGSALKEIHSLASVRSELIPEEGHYEPYQDLERDESWTVDRAAYYDSSAKSEAQSKLSKYLDSEWCSVRFYAQICEIFSRTECPLLDRRDSEQIMLKAGGMVAEIKSKLKDESLDSYDKHCSVYDLIVLSSLINSEHFMENPTKPLMREVYDASLPLPEDVSFKGREIAAWGLIDLLRHDALSFKKEESLAAVKEIGEIANNIGSGEIKSRASEIFKEVYKDNGKKGTIKEAGKALGYSSARIWMRTLLAS